MNNICIMDDIVYLENYLKHFSIQLTATFLNLTISDLKFSFATSILLNLSIFTGDLSSIILHI